MTAVPEPLHERPPQATQHRGFEEQAEIAWKSIVFLAVIVGALLAIVYLSPLRAHLGRLKEASEQIRAFGLLAPLVLMLCVALLVGIGFPRLLFCVIAGMALGFWPGPVFSILRISNLGLRNCLDS